MEFRNDFWFLSNMCEVPITYRGLTYKCVESAFQAQKCPDRAEEFVNLRGFEAKRLGKQVKLRQDWSTVKLHLMYKLLRIKFSIPEYRDKLLRTGDVEIVEDNTWRDTYWGRYKGEGENALGKLLMCIRHNIRNNN